MRVLAGTSVVLLLTLTFYLLFTIPELIFGLSAAPTLPVTVVSA